MVFPPAWLAAPDDEGSGHPNIEWASEDFRERMRIAPKQQPMGAFSQMFAGLTHHVRPAQLQHIAKSIPKVLILTGDDDNLVRPSNSVYLKEQMPSAEFVQWEKTGHAIHVQWRSKFNKLLERVLEEGRQRLEKGFTPE